MFSNAPGGRVPPLCACAVLSAGGSGTPGTMLRHSRRPIPSRARVGREASETHLGLATRPGVAFHPINRCGDQRRRLDGVSPYQKWATTYGAAALGLTVLGGPGNITLLGGTPGLIGGAMFLGGLTP